MAFVYKPRITRYIDSSGRRVKKDAPGARKKIERNKTWYGRYRDCRGELRRVSLYSDKSASRAKLNDLVRQVERKEAGLNDPFEAHGKRSLREHIEDFRRFLHAHAGGLIANGTGRLTQNPTWQGRHEIGD